MKTKDTVFSKANRVYFVGIKGIAMTALAVWAKEKGMTVAGSDIADEFPSDPILRQKDIQVSVGFDKTHVRDFHPDFVVYTGAHKGSENIEVLEAQSLGIPVMPHGQALGSAMNGKKQISVAGSHGKTTTSSMIATILTVAGLDPSYAIGCGVVKGLGLPGHYGHGRYFVAEADEYITDPTHDSTPRFLWQHPEIMVTTNIDYDHPDAYTSLAAVQDAFLMLQKQLTGNKICVANIDDPASLPLFSDMADSQKFSYGESKNAAYKISNIVFSPGKTVFQILHGTEKPVEITLKVPGKHNIYDAAAASIAGRECGVSWEDIRRGLSEFGGAKRRFEEIAKHNGITFYDDYAHHPKEIQATLAGARLWYPKSRIIAVFQPHTYSRTKKLLSDFAVAFQDADVAVCSNIYASAREKDTLGINGMTLVSEIHKNHALVVYAAGEVDIEAYLRATCKAGDVVIFIGAGDIYVWGKNIVKNLSKDV